MTTPAGVLVLNCGSSSVKLAVVQPDSGTRGVTALAERVGTPDVRATVHRGQADEDVETADSSHAGVLDALLTRLSREQLLDVAAVGHRVVHGGTRFSDPVVIGDATVDGLREVAELAPLHAPANLVGIEAARRLLPDVPHVAVFDTAFHRTLPPRAYRYAVPDAWYAELGVRRFGFHGISHRFVSERAAELLDRPLDRLRLVTLHLGNGCSATAVRDGVSVDTTMGFTPLEGLVMGTRSGDVDAGVLPYVAERTGLDLAGVVDLLNTQSGLAALSAIGNDVREISAAAADGSEAAALALDVFSYRVAKAVAALAVPLGRLDAVVFTGGIGEHSARVRGDVMAQLAVLGVTADAAANEQHGAQTAGRVSRGDGPTVMVVPTDEELAIARDAAALTRR